MASPDVYANIPDVDGRGRRGQIAKFVRWNSDPIGNDASNLSGISPALQRVVAQARADNPDLHFVIGNGRRSAADQDLAKSWGWSQVGSKDGGDALVHMNGNAVDLWGLDANNRVQFDPGQQREIAQAMQAAAGKLNVPMNWGGNFRNFKDAPHFELAGGGSAQSAGGPEGHDNASATTTPVGTTLNSSSVIDQLSKNIAQIESGSFKDPYLALGPNVAGRGQAVGKYQVMPENIPGWTLAATGKQETPDQFRNDPNAQEAVFRNQMQRSLQLYSPQDAASIWFTGLPFSKAGPNVSDKYTTNANYVARATQGITNPNLVAGSTINTTGGPAVGSQTGGASGGPGVAAGSAYTTPGSWGSGQPQSPAMEALNKAGKTMGLSNPFDQGNLPEAKPMDFPRASSSAAGGPMMMGMGGQNTAGQRTAQQALMAQGYNLSPTPANMAPTGAIMAPIGAGPPGQAPAGFNAPGGASAMPAQGLPGTTLNSPSQLQMAMLYGMPPYYNSYGTLGSPGGGSVSGSY